MDLSISVQLVVAASGVVRLNRAGDAHGAGSVTSDRWGVRGAEGLMCCCSAKDEASAADTVASNAAPRTDS